MLLHQAGRGGVRKGVRGDLARIIARALDPQRERRHSSAAELVEDLERWQRQEPLEWTRPSLARRVTLWSLRRSKRAVLLGSVLAVTGAAAVTAVCAKVADVRRDRLAQENVDRVVKLRVDDFGKFAKKVIQGNYARLIANTEGNRLDVLLPALVWIQWMEGLPVISAEGRVEGVANRIALLQGALNRLDREGQNETINAALCRFSLAYFKLGSGDREGLDELLTQIEAMDLIRLNQHDPLRDSIAALRDCWKAMDATGAEARALADGLTRTAALLHDEPMRRLLVTVARNIRDQTKSAKAILGAAATKNR